jgi:hypothetical protein
MYLRMGVEIDQVLINTNQYQYLQNRQYPPIPIRNSQEYWYCDMPRCHRFIFPNSNAAIYQTQCCYFTNPCIVNDPRSVFKCKQISVIDRISEARSTIVTILT